MSREGIIPGVFSRVLPNRQTPWVSIIFVTIIAGALLFTGSLEQLAETTVLLLLVVFAIVNVCVLVLRRDKVQGDHFRAPTVIPIIGAIVSVGLLTTKDGETFLRAAVLLALGTILWLITWFTHGRNQTRPDTSEVKTVNNPH
jgi:amino acid transporter